MQRISDHRPAADVYPITRNPRVEMLSGVGSFTSACGITLYLASPFPLLRLIDAERRAIDLCTAQVDR